uniref:Methyltransferase n=1 Tax=Gongylonema pulchrum TaxID=637853 RepID=A0A183E257_9BILA
LHPVSEHLMISIINLPAETPSEYFATAPRSRSTCEALFWQHNRPSNYKAYLPDGRRIGYPNPPVLDCPAEEKNSLFWKIHDEHEHHRYAIATFVRKTSEMVEEAGQIFLRIEPTSNKELAEFKNERPTKLELPIS